MSTDAPSARQIERLSVWGPCVLMLGPLFLAGAVYLKGGLATHWFVVGIAPTLLGTVAFVVAMTRLRGSAKRHLVAFGGRACPECGYPLEFIGARCSECGAQTSPERARDRWARAVGRLDDLPWDRMDNDGSGLPERSDKS